MRNLLVSVCFLFVAYTSFGQQQTAYEKKCYSLTVQFLKKLGVDESLLNKSSKLSDLEGFFLFGNIMKKLNTEKGIMLMLAYEREMKDAKSLMTSVDFQREKEKKEKKEREEKAKELEYQKKRAILEKENLEKERLEKYNKSDFVQLNNTIQNNFNEWLKKGEFEKTEDYNNRIRDSSQVYFEQVCNEAVNSKIDDFKHYVGEFELQNYNADKEFFNIDIKFNDLKWTDSIKVPIAQAPKFKEFFNIRNYKVSFKNWGIYENNLFPEIISLTTALERDEISDEEQNLKSKLLGYAHQFKLPINLSSYKVSSKQLGFTAISNDFVFDLSDYQLKLKKEKELEIERAKKKEEEKNRLLEEKRKKDSEEFEKLYLDTKNDVENNNFQDATLKISTSKKLRYDARFFDLEKEIERKKDSIKIENYNRQIKSLIIEYDTLVNQYFTNNSELENTVFKKYRNIHTGFNYYKTKFAPITEKSPLTDSEKLNYFQWVKSDKNNFTLLNQGISNVKLLTKSQRFLLTSDKDKLKELNSALKNFEDREMELHWKIKSLLNGE